MNGHNGSVQVSGAPGRIAEHYLEISPVVKRQLTSTYNLGITPEYAVGFEPIPEGPHGPEIPCYRRCMASKTRKYQTHWK